MDSHLLKFEAYRILSNKRYMLSLAAQILILFAILPLFSTFLSTSEVQISGPALDGFIPLGIYSESPDSALLVTALMENPRIRPFVLDNLDTELLDSGLVAAIVHIPRDYDESFNKVLEFELLTWAGNVKSSAVYDAVLQSVREASDELTIRRKESFGVSIEDPTIYEKELLYSIKIRDGSNRFSSFFLTYLLPLMLFFPLFTVGGVILDMVVGDREKKTFESILTAPVSRKNILLSKYGAAILFVGLQLLLWLLILGFYGAPLQNAPEITIVVLAVSSLLISAALLLSYYSRSVKEANLGLMLLFTLFFITLIISLSLNYFGQPFSTTPFTLVSDLLAGGQPGILFWTTFLLLLSGLILTANIGLLNRDDIVFGPHPPLHVLLEDLALWIETRGRGGMLLMPFIFGFLAIALSTLAEMLAGIVLIFAFGFTGLLIPIFAFIEELIKPLGVYFLANKRTLSKKEAAFLGAASGASFFLLESAVFVVATYYLFPTKLLALLKMRISTTLLVHMVSSGIVGLGIQRRDRFTYYLLVATAIHTAFNMIVTGGAR